MIKEGKLDTNSKQYILIFTVVESDNGDYGSLIFEDNGGRNNTIYRNQVHDIICKNFKDCIINYALFKEPDTEITDENDNDETNDSDCNEDEDDDDDPYWSIKVMNLYKFTTIKDRDNTIKVIKEFEDIIDYDSTKHTNHYIEILEYDTIKNTIS